MLLVIRHAVAGERQKWKGRPDEERPLSGRGRKQALALVKQHRERPVERILSSPYERCKATVEPLAESRGLKVETHPALEEGASWTSIRSLLREIVDQDVALCSHGDVIGLIVENLPDLGMKPAKRAEWKKSSTWVLHTRDGAFRKAVYKDPPR